MALPVGLNVVTLVGTYTSISGSPQSGSVSVAPSSVLTDASGMTVMTQIPVVATLSTAGTFSIGPIPCTDSAGTLSPLGWAYTIGVNVGGAQATLYPVYLPHSLGSTVDISTLTPEGTTLIPSGLFYLPNATSPPASPSQGGGYLYALAGALYWVGPSGSPHLIAPA